MAFELRYGSGSLRSNSVHWTGYRWTHSLVSIWPNRGPREGKTYDGCYLRFVASAERWDNAREQAMVDLVRSITSGEQVSPAPEGLHLPSLKWLFPFNFPDLRGVSVPWSEIGETQVGVSDLVKGRRDINPEEHGPIGYRAAACSDANGISEFGAYDESDLREFMAQYDRSDLLEPLIPKGKIVVGCNIQWPTPAAEKPVLIRQHILGFGEYLLQFRSH